MTQIVASPVQRQAMTAVGDFLTAVLPNGRAIATGSITATTLTVTAVTTGPISVGDAVLGENVLPGTFVVQVLTGTGGVGTYRVSVSQTAASALIWTGVPVVQAQVNRVPQVKQGDFCLITPLMRGRLSTNVDSYADVVFTGSIATNALTVSSVAMGSLAVGQVVFGEGVTANTRIIALGTGTGGTGTYTVTPSQTVTSRTLASGGALLMQPTEFSVQIDVHGPNSADNAQTVTTIFRDWSGVDIFAATGLDVTPLTISDPRQIPFINDSQQYENRWVIDASVQVNPVLRLPQQFADQLSADLIAADNEFPA